MEQGSLGKHCLKPSQPMAHVCLDSHLVEHAVVLNMWHRKSFDVYRQYIEAVTDQNRPALEVGLGEMQLVDCLVGGKLEVLDEKVRLCDAPGQEVFVMRGARLIDQLLSGMQETLDEMVRF